MTTSPHIPVLLEETLSILNIQPNDHVCDCTLGFGGHSEHILSKLEQGSLLGIDQDPYAIQFCQEKFKKNPIFSVIRANFSQIDIIKKALNGKKINKILFDLGFSSYQLDAASRGFSFTKEEPLDMRMNPNTSLQAKDILNTYSKEALSDLFFHYSDLHQNKRLAENICQTRKKKPYTTTNDFTETIKASYHFQSRTKMIKLFSAIFQALRIEVNQEFKSITKAIENLPEILENNAIVAFITFHSNEDRLVKHTMKKHPQFKAINKKVIQASQEEIRSNSRAKSAKLRGYKFST